jgi:hypothetical protein
MSSVGDEFPLGPLTAFALRHIRDDDDRQPDRPARGNPRKRVGALRTRLHPSLCNRRARFEQARRDLPQGELRPRLGQRLTLDQPMAAHEPLCRDIGELDPEVGADGDDALL